MTILTPRWSDDVLESRFHHSSSSSTLTHPSSLRVRACVLVTYDERVIGFRSGAFGRRAAGVARRPMRRCDGRYVPDMRTLFAHPAGGLALLNAMDDAAWEALQVMSGVIPGVISPRGDVRGDVRVPRCGDTDRLVGATA